MSADAQTNRLASETSPYLLQHKTNPVDWWPWGEAALDEARKTGKPILLSIGYAACHWCHVMAHESFEDDETAQVMNELFINIKVDREERPDIDAIYMSALQLLGEHGGWPLTMFLTPDAKPFWGGTYFPPDDRFGRPAFKRVLAEIARIYREEPNKVESNTIAILQRLGTRQVAQDAPALNDAMLRDVMERLVQLVDPNDGGIRGAPKFPQCSFLAFLWRTGLRFSSQSAQDAVTHTLARICQGGIYDHIGGGFARYSVDARWLVPHFEKMLYDNAQLVALLTEAWKETRNPLFAARTAETVDWLLREMRTPGGGFASSLDADSEGEEGKFYVWTPEEISTVLGEEDAAVFCREYDITLGGNFEGRNIPNRLHEPGLAGSAVEARLKQMRERLLDARANRIRPGFDDKVLADWNGLMIAALARAGRAFERPEWIRAAGQAFAFVVVEMSESDRLRHSWRKERANAPGIASDYSNMIEAALAMFEVSGDGDFLAQAHRWAASLERHHWVEGEGYALAADDTRDVIIRLVTAFDDAVPNHNGTLASALARLSLLTGDAGLLTRARNIMDAFTGQAAASIFAHTGLLSAVLDIEQPVHVVATGPDAPELIGAATRISVPGALVHATDGVENLPPGSPIVEKAKAGTGAFVCVGPVCSLPIKTAQELQLALRTARQPA